jgi:DNA-binding CsgD family transcriptional regulator/tetratricopeptide (TPR) repeat protein
VAIVLSPDQLRRAQIITLGSSIALSEKHPDLPAGGVFGETLVGRAREMATIDTFVGTAPGRLHMLVIQGEQGIGKTSLANAAARELAAERHRLVLRAAPIAGEAGLEQVVLHDLIDQCPPAVLDRVATLSREVLEVVRLARPATRPLGYREIAVAFLDLVRELARAGRPVIVLDDLQWVDPVSARVLCFVLRRSTDLDLVFVGSWSGGEPADGSPALTCPVTETWLELFEDASLPVRLLALGPLGVHELDRLIADRLGVRLSWPQLHDLHERTGGNPSMAIELVSVRAAADGRAADGRCWQAPRAWARAREIVQVEMERLPPTERRWLQALSIAHSHTAGFGARLATRLGADLAAVPVATSVLVVDGSTVRFRHPLLREAVDATVTSGERVDLHRLLAEIEDTAQGRVLHRLAAGGGPDATLADELETVAVQAVDRGARHMGAHLWERAAAVTPGQRPADRRRRLMRAWEHLLETSEPRAARIAAVEAAELAADDAERADSLLAAAITYLHGDAFDPDVVALCEAAADASCPGSATSTFAYLAAALSLCRALHLDHARVYLDQAVRTAPPDLAARAAVSLVAQLIDHAGTGRCDLGLVTADLSDIDDTIWHGILTCSWGLALVVTGRTGEASAMLDLAVERWPDGGGPAAVPGVLLPRALCEVASERPGRALELTEDALVRTGSRDPKLRRDLTAAAALALARLGRFQRARDLARAVGDAIAEVPRPREALVAITSLAALWLLLDEPGRALVLLDRLFEGTSGMNAADVPMMFWAPLMMDALIGLGEPGRARSLRDSVAPLAVTVDLAGARSRAAGVSAALALDEGRREEAGAWLEEMIVHADRHGDPWLRAWQRLQAARMALAARRSAQGLVWLDEAEAGFVELGCSGWVPVVAVERRRHTAAARLSCAEFDVARLLADGRSNRSIAEGLAISPKTVERHLTSAYRKLGVPTRTALAAWYLREHGD